MMLWRVAAFFHGSATGALCPIYPSLALGRCSARLGLGLRGAPTRRPGAGRALAWAGRDRALVGPNRKNDGSAWKTRRRRLLSNLLRRRRKIKRKALQAAFEASGWFFFEPAQHGFGVCVGGALILWRFGIATFLASLRQGLRGGPRRSTPSPHAAEARRARLPPAPALFARGARRHH